VLLLVIVLGFVYLVYRNVSQMYAPEQFQEPLQAKAEELAPELGDALSGALQDARPTYNQLVSERWEVVRPKLADTFKREAAHFRDNIVLRAETDLRRILEEPIAEREGALADRLPQLTDDKARQEFRDRLKTKLDGALARIAESTYKTNKDQVDGMLVSIGDFEADNPYMDMEQDELARTYVSLWLQMLDHYVLTEQWEMF
jgi:hypothetical protein